ATHALGQESRSVAYGVPINTWGGRANLGLYDDRTAMKEGPLRSLRITGHSTASILSIRQPVHVGATFEVDLVGGGKSRRNTSWISNVFLSRTDTMDRNLGVEAQVFGADSGWSASYVRSVGEARTVAWDGFRVDRGSLRHYRDIGGGLSFRGALAWQASPQAGLPSSEQLFIGGEGSVRGYPVGLYSGDKGQTVSLELHHPLVEPGGSGGLGADGFLFVDYGRVKPQRPPASTLRSFEALTGLGWGLNLQLGRHVSARLVFGYGATRVPLQPRSYDVTLQVVASAF
ncbi:MAG: ShlB/FhaC/HecB family hemolysin secretion/activation protein, partial [Rhodocyclaceae bacterium]|nr:ShlB/FhaC/HecB family hemolysin secretion/activation protein [Rhodocyclaceae bacterium]